MMTTIGCWFAGNVRVRPEAACPLHEHPCTEIVYYHDCEGVLIQDQKQLPYCDGFVSVYQPSLRHGDRCHRAGMQICIGVSGCGTERLPAGILPASETVKTIFHELRQEIGSSMPFRGTVLDLLAGRVVLAMRRELHGNAVETDAVEAARRILDGRFSENLSIQLVAEEVSIHPDYLRQVFRKRYGKPPMAYLLRKRIDHACELLRWSDIPIKLVAHRIGIDNPYYFSRLFRKLIGQPPSAFRAVERRMVHKTTCTHI